MKRMLDMALKMVDYVLRAAFATTLLVILWAVIALIFFLAASPGVDGQYRSEDGLLFFCGMIAFFTFVAWLVFVPYMVRDPMFLYGDRRRTRTRERQKRLEYLRSRHPEPDFRMESNAIVFRMKLIVDWFIRSCLACTAILGPFAFGWTVLLLEEGARPIGTSADVELAVWTWGFAAVLSLLFGALFLSCGWRKRYVSGLPPLRVLAFRDELAELERREHEASCRGLSTDVVQAEFIEQDEFGRRPFVRVRQRL